MNLSIKQRLLAILLPIMLVIAAFDLAQNTYTTDHVTTSLNGLVADSENLKLLGQIKFNFKSEVQAWKDLLIRGAKPDANKKYAGEIDSNKKTVDEQCETLKSHLDENGKKLVENFEIENNKLVGLYHDAHSKFLTGEEHKWQEADTVLKGLDRPVTESLKKLEQIMIESAQAHQTVALANLHQISHYSFAGKIVVQLLSIGICLFLFGRISRGLSRISTKILEETSQIRSTSSDLTNGSVQLSSAVQQQAASVQETSSCVEEIRAMVKRNSDHAKGLIQLSEASRDKVNEGKSAVDKMASSMETIRQSNHTIRDHISENNQKIREITQVIQEIDSKTKVINEIVFQTKLLSFNASVEAARAGEQGKGFAVVAEEVGALAQMSGTAAKEISELLAASIGKVDSLISSAQDQIGRIMDDAATHVDDGHKTVQACGDILEEIVHNVAQVVQSVDEIARASQEQSQGVDEIARAILQIDEASQTNSSISNHTSTAAQSLTDQADSFAEASIELIRMVEGKVHEPIHGHTKVAA